MPQFTDLTDLPPRPNPNDKWKPYLQPDGRIVKLAIGKHAGADFPTVATARNKLTHIVREMSGGNNRLVSRYVDDESALYIKVEVKPSPAKLRPIRDIPQA